MFKLIHFLAGLVGLLVAGAVWFWPVGPMWVSERGAGRICGFSTDGRTVVTCSDSVHSKQQLSRWDADTGRLLNRAEIVCDTPEDPLNFLAVRPSPDGSLALVGQGVAHAGHAGLLDFGTGVWFLHDGTTGKRLLGPIEGVNYVDFRQSFSSHGRWFAAYRGEPRSGIRQTNMLGILETTTGKCVVDAMEPHGIASCHFAPDESTAAVSWVRDGNKTAKGSLVVRVFELPSGCLRRRVEISCTFRNVVRQWDGRYLATTDVLESSRQGMVYDLSDEPLRAGVAEPFLRDHPDSSGKHVQVHWQQGDDWLAFFALIPPDTRRRGLAGWLDSIAEQIGSKRDRSLMAAVRVVDRATGTTRYELPRAVAMNLVFSADGKRLACGGGATDSFEVWSLDPQPRWPFALASGSVAAALLLALGRWRRHRAVKNAAQTVGA